MGISKCSQPLITLTSYGTKASRTRTIKCGIGNIFTPKFHMIKTYVGVFTSIDVGVLFIKFIKLKI